MPELPQILTRRVVREAPFKVVAADIRFSNGVEREYFYLCSGNTGAVIIVPMISDTEVLLIQEFGIGVNGYEWVLPKGGVDAGESDIEAANRELKEEVGYGAKQLDLLVNMSQSPNYMQHKTQIVLARNLYPEHLEGDEPEPLAVKRVNLNDIHSFVTELNITEARTIAALYLARDWIRKNV